MSSGTIQERQVRLERTQATAEEGAQDVLGLGERQREQSGTICDLSI